MPETPLLRLPLLEAAQAQKHLTHNEALMRLDWAIHLSVISRAVAAPPEAAADGARYLVPAAPSGAWAGQAGLLAVMQGGGWLFEPPRAGWRLWVEDEKKFLGFDGAEWLDLRQDSPSTPSNPGTPPEITSLPRLGINATADEVNRLAVSSPAVLLNHQGGGMQLKLNKNAAADTAALLYQNGFAGRAEMGLAGDDDFRLKVSADGTLWRDAILIDRATGVVSLPNTPVAAPPVRELFNQSLSAQGPGLAVDSYLAGSQIVLPAGVLRQGTRYRLAFDVAKTAAGIATPVISLRFGAAGALADPAIAVLSFPAQTMAVDDGRFTLDVTFRSVGAAAVVQAVAGLTHTLASTGLSNSPGPVRRATSASFNSSLAGAVIGVSVNGGSLAAWTVSLVQASLENLA